MSLQTSSQNRDQKRSQDLWFLDRVSLTAFSVVPGPILLHFTRSRKHNWKRET